MQTLKIQDCCVGYTKVREDRHEHLETRSNLAGGLPVSRDMPFSSGFVERIVLALYEKAVLPHN